MKSLNTLSYRSFGLLVWVLALALLGQPLVPLAVTHGAGRATASEKPATTSAADAATKARVEENYGKLPLSFEANKGQTDPRVKFLSRGQGYSFFLTPNEAVMTLGSRPEAKEQGARAKKETSATLRIKLVDANQQPRVIGMEEQAGKSNYFLGNDARQWKTDVPNYGKVKYESVYPGVDVVYYGNQQQLEYDFIVAPGADPKQIKLSFAGAQQMCLDENGDLVLKTRAGEVRQHKPVVYQEVNGARQEIASRYIPIGKDRVGFEVSAYDSSKTLVIDPVLSYSTFVTGNNGGGVAENIAVDAAGNAYITGWTTIDFPTTAGAPRPTPVTPPANEKWSGLSYVFVAKLNPSGSEVIYSAMIGGTRAVPTEGVFYDLENRGADIAVDAAGNAYVVGSTESRNFPTTPGAITAAYNADLGPNEYGPKGAGFALKLNATGNALEYSTLLLQALPRGVVVDAGGNAYITGSGNQGFPTTAGAFQPNQRRDPGIDFPASDAIVAKLNPTGTGFIFSTFIGGGASDIGWDIALDAAGSAYITGYTAKSVVNNGAVITSPFPETRAAFENFEGPNYVMFSRPSSAQRARWFILSCSAARGFWITVITGRTLRWIRLATLISRVSHVRLSFP